MTGALTAGLAEAERLLEESGPADAARLPEESGPADAARLPEESAGELGALCGARRVMADEREVRSRSSPLASAT